VEQQNALGAIGRDDEGVNRLLPSLLDHAELLRWEFEKSTQQPDIPGRGLPPAAFPSTHHAPIYAQLRFLEADRQAV
jgi:hypothetical protein